MPSVAIIILNYQKNHQGFYENLLDNVFKGYKIDLLVFDFNVNKFCRSRNCFLHKPKHIYESKTVFLVRNFKILKEAHVLVFEEIYVFDPISIFTVLYFGKKAHITIHNANKWLKRGKACSAKDIIKQLLFKTIKKSINGIIVISQTVKEYIISNNLFNKQIYYFPFANFSGEQHLNHKANFDEPIIFTIPGTINSERRNYLLFLEVFIKLLNEDNLKFKLVLLGKVIKLGNKEQNLINEINKKSPNTVLLWRKFIDEKSFENWLLSSNYLIGNINVLYTENTVTEIYGESKETGVLFLMLRYGIPTFFPKEYKFSNVYEDCIIKYNQNPQALYETIKSTLNKPKIIGTSVLNRHQSIINKEINDFNNNVCKK